MADPAPPNTSTETGTTFQELRTSLSHPFLAISDNFQRHATRLAQQRYADGLINYQNINPLRLYEGKDGNTFHGFWKNADIILGSPGITWEKTLQEVGKRETVHEALDIMAHAYGEAFSFYDWKHADVPGFYVESMPNNGMLSPDNYGFAVSYENHARPLVNLLKSENALLPKQVNYLTSEFIHELAHHEFDENPALFGGGQAEAVSQGVQFLYAPGENPVYELDIMKNQLNKVEQALDSRNKSKVHTYEVGGITWMTKFQETLHTQFPQLFESISDDGKKNIALFRKLPQATHQLRKVLGEEKWQDVKNGLIKSLMDYDPDSQGTIVADFRRDANKYGFGMLAQAA